MMNLRLSTLSVCLFNQSVYQLIEALKARFDLGASNNLTPKISEPKILKFLKIKLLSLKAKILSTRSKEAQKNPRGSFEFRVDRT